MLTLKRIGLTQADLGELHPFVAFEHLHVIGRQRTGDTDLRVVVIDRTDGQERHAVDGLVLGLAGDRRHGTVSSFTVNSSVIRLLLQEFLREHQSEAAEGLREIGDIGAFVDDDGGPAFPA